MLVPKNAINCYGEKQAVAAAYSPSAAITEMDWSANNRRLRFQASNNDALASSHFMRARELMRNGDLDGALSEALRAGALIENSTNHSLMYKIGAALQPLGSRDVGAKLISKAERIRTGTTRREWSGENISEQTLLVEWTRGDIDIGIRSVGLTLPPSFIQRRLESGGS